MYDSKFIIPPFYAPKVFFFYIPYIPTRDGQFFVGSWTPSRSWVSDSTWYSVARPSRPMRNAVHGPPPLSSCSSWRCVESSFVGLDS